MKKAPDLFPLLLTLCLVAWTAAVHRYAEYGSWHVYPALAWAPSVLISHMALIIRKPSRAGYALYGVAHLAVAVPLWIGCLMLISKDAF